GAVSRLPAEPALLPQTIPDARRLRLVEDPTEAAPPAVPAAGMQPAAVPAATVPPAGVRPPEVVVALSEHQARISSVHERSLALGTAMHQRFLRSQWQAEAALRAAHAVFGGRRPSLTPSDPVPPVQPSTTPSNVIPFPRRGAPARRRPGQHAQVPVADGIRGDETSMRARARGKPCGPVG